MFTMATNPQLKNHLIRELIATTQLETNGEAMVRLALSGKGPFNVVKYIIESHVYAYADWGGVSVSCLSQYVYLLVPIGIEFETEGSKRLVFRFVLDLIVDNPTAQVLSFENITNLTIRRYAKPLTAILDLWSGLEVLKTGEIPDAAFDDFFNDFVKTSLPNLRRLEVGLTLNGCIKMMTLTPALPLPEEVNLLLTVRESVLDDFGSPNTFPNVKHFVVTFLGWTDMTAELLDRLLTIIKCFTRLETAKLALSHDHRPGEKEFAGIVKFHELLRNTKFSTPVEIDLKESVDISYIEDKESVYAKLKSIGFKEAGVPRCLVMRKEYGNVKLVHRVEHYYLEAYPIDEDE